MRNGLFKYVVKNWLARKRAMMELLNIHGAKLANTGTLWTPSDRHLPLMVQWDLPRMDANTPTRFALFRSSIREKYESCK